MVRACPYLPDLTGDPPVVPGSARTCCPLLCRSSRLRVPSASCPWPRAESHEEMLACLASRTVLTPGGQLPSPSPILNFIILVHLKSSSGHILLSVPSCPSADTFAEETSLLLRPTRENLYASCSSLPACHCPRSECYCAASQGCRGERAPRAQLRPRRPASREPLTPPAWPQPLHL